MEYIITFKNTSSSVKAEQCLLQRGLNVGVLPLPPQIRAGCGICLRLGAEQIDAALEHLRDSAVAHDGVFTRETQGGAHIYSERIE